MGSKHRASCLNCRRRQSRLDAQAAQLDALKAQVEALHATVARLQEQLAAARKDSSTSSKPPSSDIVKPPKPPPPEGQDKRRIGGQPGHPKHERAAFPPEAINGGSFDHRLDSCPSCGQDLQPALTIPPRVVQQVDIREVPLSIQEHRSHPGWCPHCQKMYEAPLPPGDRAGRPGRAVPDHVDRLPQGGLPRLLLDHPQVPPRCRAGDDLARGTGQDHRQGQPGVGATLSGVARRPARPGAAQRR